LVTLKWCSTICQELIMEAVNALMSLHRCAG
jgi:hypothetical protein